MSQPLINITRKQALVFSAFLVLYEFLTYVANDMIMPGMVLVIKTFNAPESAIATSLTAYILGGASLQLFLGPLSDRFGRRPIMLFGAAFFFVCTALIGFSNSIDHFLIARFFQGMGLCFIAVIGYATLQEIFAEMDAIRLIAVMANIAILAPLIGPLFGAVFFHYFHWRHIFLVVGLFALLALWGLWRFMPESIGQVKRDGEEIKAVPLSPRQVFQNYKQLLLNPTVLLGSLALGLVSLPCLVWIALAPLMLIKKANLSIIQYALWQIPLFGANIAGTWLLRKLSQDATLRKIVWIASIIIILSLLALALLVWLSGSHDYKWLLPGLIVYFFGLGLGTAPLNRFVLFSTPIAKGTTSAFISILVMIILALGIEVGNYIYATHNNLYFALYCTSTGILYFLIFTIVFRIAKKT